MFLDTTTFWYLFSGTIGIVAIGLTVQAMEDAKAHARWSQLPILDEYLKAHPHCNTSSGPKCFSCNSQHLKNWGNTSSTDLNRTIMCQKCGTVLYRITQNMP